MESTTVNYMHQQMTTVATVGTELMSNIGSCSGRLENKVRQTSYIISHSSLIGCIILLSQEVVL
jgi:hypothetical protein